MTLSTNDQLKLLYDLLEEHLSEFTGSVSEYQQIKRVVQSLISKDKIVDEQLLQVLPEIYNYGLQGESVQSLTEHISTNSKNIESWKSVIQENKLE